MENDINRAVSAFRNLSSRVSEMIYLDFRSSVKKLDRQTDENVFQKLQARYIAELENQLNQAAGKLISEFRGNSLVNTLQYELSNRVAYLLSEFLLKAKSL